MTLRDMLVRLSEMFGVADESGSVNAPVGDTATRDKFTRYLNDAISTVASIYPWMWLRPELTVTLSADGTAKDCVGGSLTEYLLPDWIRSVPVGDITWKSPDASYGGNAKATYIDHIRGKQAADGAMLGPPQLVCVFPAASKQGDSQNYHMHVWPKPDLAYTVTARFRRSVQPLVADGDRGIWPPEHDRMMLYAGAQALLDAGVEGATDPQRVRDTAAELVAIARKLDQELQPPRVGNLSQWFEKNASQDHTPIGVYGTTVIGA